MTLSDISELAALITRKVHREGALYNVEMTRDYDYPIEDVWSAWTSPERLPRWLGEPRGDLHVGGRVDLAMELDVIELTILECERPTLLAVTWHDGDEPESEVRLRLEPLDKARTRLILVHSMIDADHAIIYGPGWEEFLYVLDVFLDGGSKDTVAWDRHGVVLALTEEWRNATGLVGANQRTAYNPAS